MGFNPWQKPGHRVKNATPTQVGGEAFPSKMEAAVYEYLKRREYLGEIQDIQRQQTVVLQDGPRETRITWKIDFSFRRRADGALVYVEAKGFPTEIYKLKLKMFRYNPPADLEVYGGSYNRIKLTEKITKGEK